MGNDKNHLYSEFDIDKDRKNVNKRLTQQSFSRFSVAALTSVNNANFQTNSPPFQGETKPQIGNPYDDTLGSVGPSTVNIDFSVFGSTYTFLTAVDDVSFAFNGLPTGRHIRFVIDVTVDNVAGITLSFPEVTNPPALAGNDGDRYVLIFEGVNRTDPEGVISPVETYTFLSGTTNSGNGHVIQDEGVPLTQRLNLNFVGAGVTVTDDVGNNASVVTITGGSGTLPTGTEENDHLEWDNTGMMWNPTRELNFGTVANPGPVVGVLNMGNNQNLAWFKTNGVDVVLLGVGANDVLNLINADFDVNARDIINVDRLNFVKDSEAPGDPQDALIYLDSADFMTFNVDDGAGYNWDILNITSATLQLVGVSEDPAFVLRGREDASPLFRLERDDSTPNVGQVVGRVEFLGNDSTGSNLEEYARIDCEIVDMTVGNQGGALRLRPTHNSSAINFMTLNHLNNNKITVFRNLIFDTVIADIELNGNDLWLDSGLETKLSGSETAFNVTVDAVLVATFNSTSLVMQPDKDISTRGILLSPTTTTFLLDGQLWYDSATNKFKGRENGVTVDIVGGSGNSISQGNSNVTVTDAGVGNVDFTVDGVSRMNLIASGLDMASDLRMNGNILYIDSDNDSYITQNGDDIISFNTANTERIRISNSALTFSSGVDADMAGNDIILTADGNTKINNVVNNQIGFDINSVLSSMTFTLINGAGAINWPVAGHGHRILSETTGLVIETGAVSDSIKLQNSDDSSNFIFDRDGFNFITTQDMADLVMQAIPSGSTMDNDVFSRTRYIGKNSAPANIEFVRTEAILQDVTSGSEDGAFKISAISGGDLDTFLYVGAFEMNYQRESNPANLTLTRNEASTPQTGVISEIKWQTQDANDDIQTYGEINVNATDISAGNETSNVSIIGYNNGNGEDFIFYEGGVGLTIIDGNSANDKLGFFGEPPVVRQQLDANPTNEEISTVLRNYGLTEL